MSYELSIVFKSTVIFACAGLVALTLRRASASTRHLVWAIGFCAALILPAVSTVLPAIELPLLPQQGEVAMSGAESMSLNIGDLPASTGSHGGVAGYLSEGMAAAARPSRFGPWAKRNVLSLLWAVGALIVFIRTLGGIWELRRLKRASTATVDKNWRSCLVQLQHALSVSKSVELRVGNDAVPPMTWGVFRHTILMPITARNWTAERCRLVIAHELAHIGRHDGLMQIFVRVACGLYWFNPMVWFAARHLKIERERACDDRVLSLGGEADDYADHLLQIARDANSGFSFAAVSMANPSQLESRLRAILNPRTHRQTLTKVATAALVVSGALLTGSLAAIQVTALAGLALPASAIAMAAPILEPVGPSLAVAPQQPSEPIQSVVTTNGTTAPLLNLPVGMRTDYVKVNDDQIMVLMTFQIDLKDLSFKTDNGVFRSVVHSAGDVSNPSRLRIGPFEQTGEILLTPQEFQSIQSQKSVYQTILWLRPGLYRFDLIVKDMNSGNLGQVQQAIQVPRFAGQGLAVSSLILADLMEPLASGQAAGGQFLIGDTRIRPSLKREFRREQDLNVWAQVYNLKVDDVTRQPSGRTEILIMRNGAEIQRIVVEGAGAAASDQMTVSRTIPLKDFEPGQYEVQFKVTDNLTREVQATNGRFSVR